MPQYLVPVSTPTIVTVRRNRNDDRTDPCAHSRVDRVGVGAQGPKVYPASREVREISFVLGRELSGTARTEDLQTPPHVHP
jgi:hypothetical protein